MNSKYYTFQADLSLGTEDGDSYRFGAYKQDKLFQRSQFSPSGRYLMQAVTVETRSKMAIQLRITDFIAQTYHHYCTGPLPIHDFNSPAKIIACYWTDENTIGIYLYTLFVGKTYPEIVCCYWTDEDTINFWIHEPSTYEGRTSNFMEQLNVRVDHVAKRTWCVSYPGVMFKTSGEPRCSTTNPIIIGQRKFIVVGDKQSLCLVPFYYGFAEIIYIDYPKNYGVHYSVEDPVYVHENKVFFQTNKKGKECANEMLYLDLNNLEITVHKHELDDFKKAVFKDKGYQPSFIKSRRKNSVQCGRYVIRWAGGLKNRRTVLYLLDLKDLRITKIGARIAGYDCPTILNDSLLMFRNITAPRVGVPLEDMQYISIPNVVSYSKGTVVSLCTAALNAVLMSDAYDVEERELCHKKLFKLNPVCLIVN